MHEQREKDFVNRREEDDCMIKLREQRSKKMKKKKHGGSMLWQDTMKGRKATMMRVCLEA